jgi:hypothetical protein
MKKVGDKEKEIMRFLHEKVFDPILTSSEASESLKQGIRYTIMRMNERDAAGMIRYYWSAIARTRALLLPPSSRRKGLTALRRRLTNFAYASMTAS